jgi:hypothetical protein
MELASIGELEEGLLLEMSEPFWTAPAERRIGAAAQIVYTMAALEDGKRVTFLRGALPHPIETGSGLRSRGPVARGLYSNMGPWIVTSQPVAGSTVGTQIPLRARLRGRGSLTAALVVEERTVARVTAETGMATIEVPQGVGGPAIVRVSGRLEGALRYVEIPLTIAPSG